MRHALRVISATFLGLMLAGSGVGKEKAAPAASPETVLSLWRSSFFPPLLWPSPDMSATP